MELKKKTVLFEPWGLGDAIIAASVLRERPEDFVLACDSKWEPIFRAVFPNPEDFQTIPFSLEYTSRTRKHWFQNETKNCYLQEITRVLSIRGDFRDWLASRRIFPKAQIQVSGWLAFIIRRFPPFDIIFRSGRFPIRNRYRAWARLTGVSYSAVEATYNRLQKSTGKDEKITIHVGAQWKSRQYPHVKALKDSLEAAGFQVQLIAGPQDSLPELVSETEVRRTQADELVSTLSKASWVIANDSGPMHLSAFLGAKTFVIARISNIEEWLPPATTAIRSSMMPKGYAPDSHYTTDEVVQGWPEVQEITSHFKMNRQEPQTS